MEPEKLSTAIPPTTTAEQNLTTAGQRRVNLIWEFTQAGIAIMVSAVTLTVSALVVHRDPANSAAFLLLSNSFFLVVGFYFGRTNHQRTGGVGARPQTEYEGR